MLTDKSSALKIHRVTLHSDWETEHRGVHNPCEQMVLPSVASHSIFVAVKAVINSHQ